MAHMQQMLLAAKTGVVTVSSESVVAGTGEVAGIRYNADGTVDNNIDGVYTQVNSSTDWIIPNSAASSAYQIRATLNSGDTPDGTLGSWLALSSNREWTLTSTGSCSLNIEIGYGGVAESSGTVTLSSG